MSLELNETLQSVVDGLTELFSDTLIEVYQSSGDTFVRVEADSIVEICKYLKEKQHFIFLCDVFGIDRYTTNERFEVVGVNSFSFSLGRPMKKISSKRPFLKISGGNL